MIDASEYCRALETYLCRKNEGHLVRIVGPVFEQVCGWAERGVPLAIACRGIDRYCERYYAKGVRRRPVRIEFCEADILDLFDDWRRAVGVTAAREETRDRETLPAHLERVIARLTALRGGRRFSDTFDDLVHTSVRELDAARGRAKQARGSDRAALVAHLETIDRALVERAIAELTSEERTALERSAAEEIAPFVPRMTPDARDRAARVAFERLTRDRIGLPIVAFEQA
jgi:hypothetical protein